MDEKQLQFLYSEYAKNKGFKDYSEFKGLMSSEGSRKLFFDDANTELGFKDYNEFNDLLGLKKKAGGEVSSLSKSQLVLPDFEKGKAFAEKGFLMKGEGTKEQKRISFEPSLSNIGAPFKVKVLEEGEEPSFAADLMTVGARGQIQGKVANLLPAGKIPTNEELGEVAQLQSDVKLLPQTKAEKLFQERGLIGLFKENPALGVQYVAETMTSSFSALLEASKRTVPTAVAMGAAAGAPIAGVGGFLGAGVGLLGGQSAAGYNLSTSQDILSSLSENGVDVSDKESLIKAFSDEKKMAKIRDTAAKYGVPILAFDIATAGLAGKFLSGAMGKSLSKKILAGLGETGIQIAGGSGGELAAQIASGKKINWDEIALEGLAEVPGGVSEVATGVAIERNKTASNNKTLATQIAYQGTENGVQDAVVNLNRDLANKVITPEQHQQGLNFVEKAAQVSDKVPENVVGGNRAKSIELLVERNNIKEINQNLLQQKQTTDEAYHIGIDEEIKANEERLKKLDSEIYDISKKPTEEKVRPEIKITEEEITPEQEVTVTEEVKTISKEKNEKFNTPVLKSKASNFEVLYVPKNVVEAAYENDIANKERTGGAQSLETIIKRGGYSIEELNKLLPNWKEIASGKEVKPTKVKVKSIIKSKFNKPINQELLETIPEKDISDVVEKIDNGEAKLNVDVFPATDLGTDNKITNNQNVYLLHSQGKEIGVLTVNNETLGNRNESSIAGVVLHPDVKGKGIGKEIYRFVNNDLINKRKAPLKSDFDITPDAINVWESLVKSGEAKQVGIAENGKPLFEMNKPTEVKEAPKKTYQEALKEKQAAEKKQTRQTAGEKAAVTRKTIVESNKIEASDARSAALKYLTGGKLSWDAINEVAGRVKRATLNTGAREFKSEEARSRDYVAKKGEGESLDEAADSIWNDLSQEIQDKMDTQDVKNALMMAVSEYNSKAEMAQALIDGYKEESIEELENKYYERFGDNAEIEIDKELNQVPKNQLDIEQELINANYESEQQFQDDYWNTKEATNDFTEKAPSAKAQKAETAKGLAEAYKDFTINQKRQIINSKFDELLKELKIEKICPT
jgi:hypothetical protein